MKTRLAKDVGEEKALEIYLKLLAITRQAALQVQVPRLLWYSDAVEERDDWPPGYFEKKQQSGNDLGERMKNAFRYAFDRGHKKVVIIGSDCPDLTSGILKEAFLQLEESPVVIGPANDGGYYLLGMKGFHNLFDDITWSTETVLDKTIEKMRNSGLNYFKLPRLTDIDTIDDLKKTTAL